MDADLDAVDVRRLGRRPHGLAEFLVLVGRVALGVRRDDAFETGLRREVERLLQLVAHEVDVAVQMGPHRLEPGVVAQLLERLCRQTVVVVELDAVVAARPQRGENARRFLPENLVDGVELQAVPRLEGRPVQAGDSRCRDSRPHSRDKPSSGQFNRHLLSFLLSAFRERRRRAGTRSAGS